MGSTFLPERCKHIDTVGTNVLIRGNMPLLGSDLHYAFNEIAVASKVSDLATRKLVEVPIIDNVGERDQWAPIMRSFGVDPGRFPITYWPPQRQPGWKPNKMLGKTLRTEGQVLQGSVVWRPFEGLPVGEDPKPYLSAPGWDFSGFIDHVIDLLHTLNNTAIYVHCQLGADRTGAFHIGYLMKSRGWDLDSATMTAVSATPAGPPNADYMRLVTAYAQTLRV